MSYHITAPAHHTTPDTHLQGHILVVDDEPEIIKALQRQFRQKYKVYAASSAQEGYEVIARFPIQVIISDQRMPEMTGTEFFKRVRHDYPDAIRLLLTGYADLQAVIAAINDGNVFRYITKPWDPAELDAVVEQAFEYYNLLVQNRQLVYDLRHAKLDLEQRVQERTAELVELNNQLKALALEKDRFIGMVVHDLRSPIANILMTSRYLLDPDAQLVDQERERFLKEIYEQAEYMLALINDLLDVSQIETGALNLKLELIDLDSFLQEAIQRHAQAAREKNVMIVLDYGTTGQVVADPVRLRQVIDNLLSNALKYTPIGSTVRVFTHQVGDSWQVNVQDEGPGITPEDRNRLFQYFAPLSAKPTGGEKSTGLGLAIARRVIEEHGGEIGVDSRHGQGATFWFTLPG